MECSRCSGLMITDRYLGLDGQLPVLRCANCGSIIDAKIRHHQQRQGQHTKLQRRRARHQFPRLSRLTFTLLHHE
jgi:uncharacterized Zn finger protein